MAHFRNLEASPLEVPTYGVTLAPGDLLFVPDEDTNQFQGFSWARVD
jgi:hypothetical protein